jgi:hypothetical protein
MSMLESRSRLENGAKKTEAVTVKLPESTFHFCNARARQQGMESAPEYIRHLIEKDKSQTEHEFILMGESLGVKVSLGILDSDAALNAVKS